MRIIGFQKIDWMNYNTHYPKLLYETFTTFRLPRKDRDWELGEVVRVVLKPRSKEREMLGEAEIIQKDTKEHYGLADNRITEEEARVDGFLRDYELEHFLFYRPDRRDCRTANKLTLRWLCWFPAMIKYSLRH